MQCLVLGTMVEDTISNTKGMLTHMQIHIGEHKEYIYQPKGLNPKNGQPVDRIWLTEPRVKKGEWEELDVPVELLGTEAEDIATGFKGRIVSLIYHLNGCLHVEIKPEGTNKDNGATVASAEFDIRRVKGEAIKPLKKKELKESIKNVPSPIGMIDGKSR